MTSEGSQTPSSRVTAASRGAGGPGRDHRGVQRIARRRPCPAGPTPARRRRRRATASSRTRGHPRGARPCHGQIRPPQSTLPVARSAPRCGQAAGPTCRPPLLVAPGDDLDTRRPGAERRSVRTSVLAAKTNQLPLGRRSARCSAGVDESPARPAGRWASGRPSRIFGRTCSGMSFGHLLGEPRSRLITRAPFSSGQPPQNRRATLHRHGVQGVPADPPARQQPVGRRPSGGGGPLHQGYRQVDADPVTGEHQTGHRGVDRGPALRRSRARTAGSRRLSRMRSATMSGRARSPGRAGAAGASIRSRRPSNGGGSTTE